MCSCLRRSVVALLVSLAAAGAVGAQQPDPSVAAAGPVDSILASIQSQLERGDEAGFRALFARWVAPEDVDAATETLTWSDVTHATIRERDRAALVDVPPGAGYRLVVELFIEQGGRGRIVTLRLDVRVHPLADEAQPGEKPAWKIVAAERLTVIDGLFRLGLNPKKQFDVKNLIVTGEDLTLEIPTGTAFVAETEAGPTALVVLGSGRMLFSPRSDAERGQIRILSGAEILDAQFNNAFIRLNPSDAATRLSPGGLVQRSVDQAAFARATTVFHEEVSKSFGLDLSDLSRETWSLVPSFGDLLVEVRTRKYGTLTYARSGTEAEDISLFDRQRKRNISIYPSQRKVEQRGRGYDEDELADYDVLDYNVDAIYVPERLWFDGRVRLRLRVRSYALATITLRLAEPLVVRSITSERFGRLLSLRVRGQNSVLVSLPTPVPRDTTLELTVSYSGRLEPQTPEREVIVAGQSISPDAPALDPEPRFVYSNRSYWYPQAPVSDYATSTLRVTVPDGWDAIASGDPVEGSPVVATGRRMYIFAASQPLRYLSFVASRFQQSGDTMLKQPPLDPPPAASESARAADASIRPTGGDATQDGTDRTQVDPRGVQYEAQDIIVMANPRQASRGRNLLPQVTDVLGVYASILGDLPYPSFTLALVDNELPGGHSPAYFALLHQPLPTTPYVWRGDPVYFDNFPQFFLAHELAHQYWGQAVGWKSYHEQWLSEGFAQYFAALYGARRRGPEVFADLLRQMRRWAIAQSDQGPIWLGYRVGHIKGDMRGFRAVIYNKGAMVLHMLRRLLGDDAFFTGLRSFYRDSRFKKTGTAELQTTFERLAGRSLERFFEGWVYGQAIPDVRWRYELLPGGTASQATSVSTPTGAGFSPGDAALQVTAGEGGAGQVRVMLEQATDLHEIPVTVSLVYASGQREDRVVVISTRSTDVRFLLKGPLRRVEVNDDNASLARFERR